MKTFLLTAILTVASSTIAAQPILTSAYNPTVGTTNVIAQCDTTGVNPGPSGANETWSFTLIPNSPFATHAFVNANGATSYDFLFPYANIAYPESNSNIYTFIQTSNTGIYHWGFSSNSEAEYNSNSRRELRYPFSFSESFTDYYEFTQTLTSPAGSGEQTVSFDGFGTLIVNGYIFNNVFRIHTSRDDTYGSGPVSHIEMYRWIDPAMPGKYLLNITINNGYKLVQVADIAVSNVETLDQIQFDIYPNVVTDSKANLVLDTKSNGHMRIEICNTIGQAVKTKNVNESQNGLVELDLSGLVKGVYFVIVTNEKGNRSVRRIVVM